MRHTGEAQAFSRCGAKRGTDTKRGRSGPFFVRALRGIAPGPSPSGGRRSLVRGVDHAPKGAYASSARGVRPECCTVDGESAVRGGSQSTNGGRLRCGGWGRSDLRGRLTSRSGRCSASSATSRIRVAGARAGACGWCSTTVAAVGVLAAAVPLVANAVLGTDGPTLFELDGNIADDSGAPNLPQDWSDFQQAPGNGNGPVAKTFITDGFNGTTTRSSRVAARRTTTTSRAGRGTAARFRRRATSSTRSLRPISRTTTSTSTSAPTATTRRAARPMSASGSSRVAARCTGGTGCPDLEQDSEQVQRRARERRHLRLRRVRGRRRRLGHLDLRVAERCSQPPVREDRGQLLQPGGHDLRQDEHRPDRRSVDVLRQPGDGGREDHDRRLLRGRHQPVCSLPGSRQGHSPASTSSSPSRAAPIRTPAFSRTSQVAASTSVRSSSSTRSPLPPVTRRNSPSRSPGQTRTASHLRSPTAIRPSTVAW